MEVNMWGCLWNLDGGPFLMRQRIPEVCVFKGCHLDAWYYSNPNGLLLRRRDDITINDLLHVFSAAARDGSERHDEQMPAAILRRQSIKLDDGSAPLEVPHAVVLTLRELKDLMRRVQGGVAEDDIWSVQTVVQPEDGLRVISVYSCDGTGKEKSEVFARQYHRCYALTPQTITLPSADDLAADACITVLPSRRTVVESKTLNAVRFASRFHNLDFEGLVLEFVFDAEGRALLHGCWCSTIFPLEARRRLRGRPTGAARQAPPRSFPVPTVEEQEEGQPAEAPPAARAPPGAAAAFEPPPAKTEGGGAEGYCVVLEVWRGECFLGEALLPRQRPGAPPEQTLELRAGETSWPSRLDSRKRRPGAEHAAEAAEEPPAGAVALRAEWARGEQGAPLLRLALLRAVGLPPAPPGEGPGPRVRLWQRRWGSSEFMALWSSSEGREREPLVFDSPKPDGPGPVVWDEPVNLNLAPVQSAAGREEAPRSPACSARELRGGPPKSTPEPALLHQPCPIELQTSLKSKDEHVCGAELFTHWGMSESDGSMRTHLLSSQVAQRMGTECRGRETRSSLLTKMAMQLEQFHDLQVEWEEELAAAKATFQRVAGELESRDKETVLIREETSSMVQEHERRLAALCCDMHGTVDEHRIQREYDEEEREASQARIAQKRNMVRHLREKNESLEDSLHRTVRKFDEVSTSYAALQRELGRRQAAQPPPPPPAHPDLLTATSRAHGLALEVAQEERDLVEMKGRLGRLREDLAAERAHSAKLEDFVRRMASAPATRMRTGGGFDMDYTARREAALLIQEMAQG